MWVAAPVAFEFSNAATRDSSEVLAAPIVASGVASGASPPVPQMDAANAAASATARVAAWVGFCLNSSTAEPIHPWHHGFVSPWHSQHLMKP